MYCALDRVDIIAGTHRFQTDHRTVEEIEQEPELSVLFALTRITNARRDDRARAARSGGGDGAVVLVARDRCRPSRCR